MNHTTTNFFNLPLKALNAVKQNNIMDIDGLSVNMEFHQSLHDEFFLSLRYDEIESRKIISTEGLLIGDVLELAFGFRDTIIKYKFDMIHKLDGQELSNDPTIISILESFIKDIK